VLPSHTGGLGVKADCRRNFGSQEYPQCIRCPHRPQVWETNNRFVSNSVLRKIPGVDDTPGFAVLPSRQGSHPRSPVEMQSARVDGHGSAANRRASSSFIPHKVKHCVDPLTFSLVRSNRIFPIEARLACNCALSSAHREIHWANFSGSSADIRPRSRLTLSVAMISPVRFSQASQSSSRYFTISCARIRLTWRAGCQERSS